jgi:hypothetical protein
VGYSPTKGWVFGYKLYLTCTTTTTTTATTTTAEAGKIIVPLTADVTTADVTTANVPDKRYMFL